MLRVRLSLLLVLVFTGFQSFSVDKYWRPVDNSFHNPANWDPAGIPSAADRIIFDQFGNADCVVYLDASVSGHLQYNNYTGIVSLQPGVNYTVGNTGFWMDSGGFYSNDEELDINGSLEIHGGGFLSSTAITHVAGNLEINPWPLGGWFTDAGIIMIDGGAYTTLVSNVDVKHLQMNKPFGYYMTIPAGMTLTVSEQFDFMDGVVNGPGKPQILEDCSIEATSDGGNVPFWFVGGATSHVAMDKNSHNCGNFVVAKSTNVDSVIVTSSIAELGFMHSTDSLILQSGVFNVQHPNITLQQKVTQLQPLSTFLASENVMNLERDWDNDGGTFMHRNGHVNITGANYSYFSFDVQESFWNLNLNKPFTYSLTLEGTDKMVVENKMTCTDGFLHGPTAWLSILDSLHYISTFDEGNSQLEFVGNQTNHFILDHASHLLNHLEINKTSATDSVLIETNSAHLEIGDNAGDEIYVNTGVLAFAKCGSQVDWDVKDLHIMPGGTFLCWSGTTNFSNNLYNNGGEFKHNNANFVADGNGYAYYDVDDNIRFFNYSLEKPSGYSVTIAGTDSLIAENKYTSRYGYMQGSTALVVALDSAFIQTTHTKGSTNLTFAGASDGHMIFDRGNVGYGIIEINKDNPSSTVWFETNNAALAIGNNANEDLDITRGTVRFQNVGTHVDWNLDQVNIHPDGTLEAYSGTTNCSGNMHELGGMFDHNNGTWIWDGNGYSLIDGLSEIQFYTLQMLKPSGYSVTINGNDSIRVMNKYTSTYGYLHGPSATFMAEDSVVVVSSHIKGNANLTFTGAADGHLIFNQTNAGYGIIEIKKDDPNTTVWFETNNATFSIGNNSNEDLDITRGTVRFQNVGTHVDWNLDQVNIHPDGTLEAYSGTTNSSGNMHELGGIFDHNDGVWVWDGNGYTIIDGLSEIQFHTLEMRKPSGYSITMGAGNSVRVFNKYTSTYGYLHGPTALLLVEDSTVITSTHIKGNAPIEFSGPGDAWLINNHGSQFFTNTRINKTNPGDIVWYEAGSGDLTMSAASENLYLDQGILAFQNYGTQVNWNVGHTYVQGGTFRAPAMLLNWKKDAHFDSGAFDHNMGAISFTGGDYSNITGSFAPNFYDIIWDKPFGYSTTIVAPQYVESEHHCTYVVGYLHGGEVHANGDVFVQSTWTGGNSPLVFTGSTDQEFDLTGGESKLEGVIEINKPSGVVELQSNLVIEDNFAQLKLTNGLLTSADPSSFNPFFSNIATGWSGGNDDSYIACPALASGFSALMVPVGDDGVFAPAGISNASVMATYRITYHHSDPNIAFGTSVTSPIDHIAQCEHWTITADTGAPTAIIHLSYDTDRCGAIDVPAELVVSAWNSGLSTWESTGQSSDNGVKIGGSTVANEWIAFTLGSTTTNNPMDGSTGDCAGDFNGDGQIDTTDLLSILGGFGCTGTCVHDLSGDGDVNTTDLLQFLGLFGTACI